MSARSRICRATEGAEPFHLSATDKTNTGLVPLSHRAERGIGAVDAKRKKRVLLKSVDNRVV